MRFHFLLTNHYPYGCYKIEDIVLPIAAGLAELGHRITYGFDDDVPPWPAVNLLVEFFNDPAVVDQVIRLRGTKDRYCFGLIGHEDVAEAAIMAHPNFPDRRPNLERLMPHLDFGWTIVPCDYAMFDGGERMRFLEFGYAETLRRDPPMQSDLDVVFYSDLGPRRVPLYNELVQRGLRVSATFGVLPDFVKFDQLERARVMADVRRADDVRFGAPTRVCAALHRGISIVAERPAPGPLDRLYRYTLTCEIAEFLDRCQQMALAPAGREFGLTAREMFHKETSMRANLLRVMDHQVFTELAAAPPAG